MQKPWVEQGMVWVNNPAGTQNFSIQVALKDFKVSRLGSAHGEGYIMSVLDSVHAVIVDWSWGNSDKAGSYHANGYKYDF